MRDGYIKVGSVSPHVIVADTVSNACRTVELVRKADEKGVKVLVFPELSLTGYTLGDLVFSSDLLQGAIRALEKVCGETRDLDVLAVVGLPLQDHGKTSMLQDVQACRETENRYFAGAVSRLGKKYSIPTPISDFVAILLEAKRYVKAAE